jgi:beta-glucosidase
MADAKKPRKKMTRRGFIASGATAAGLVGVTVAANVGTNMFKSAIDHYIGGGETTITNAPGSEEWDTAYYDRQYRGRGRATEEAKNIVIEIEGEGIVLLKNDNNALPLASGESVSLIGRYAADAVYGGAGSGTVDPNDCVTLYDGIVNAGLAVNDTAYNWIAENYANYPKANITMDNPSTASYYIGEIPWSAYSDEAKNSIAGTTAVVAAVRAATSPATFSPT